MKTAVELFKKYKIEIGGTNAVLKNEFGLAITERDQEWRSRIDEMIKKQNIDKWFDKDDVCDILTELKKG